VAAQVDEQLPVRERRAQPVRGVHGQRRLPDPRHPADDPDRGPAAGAPALAGPGQGSGDLVQLAVPAGEGDGVGRQRVAHLDGAGLRRPWPGGSWPGGPRAAGLGPRAGKPRAGGPAAAAPGRARHRQGRVIVADPLVQPLQLRAGLRAQLVDQDVAGGLVSGQRRAALAVPVQRGHQQPVQPLPQRLRRGQLGQLGQDGRGPAELQVSINAGLQRLQPQLREPGSLAGVQRLAAHPGQRLAAPQRQAGGQLPRRGRPLPFPGGGPPRGQGRLEPGDVQVRGADPDQVAARLGDDRRRGAAQRLAQPHHAVLQAHLRRRRRGLAPEQVGQLAGAGRPPGLEQEGRQQHALLARRNRHLGPADPCCERPEQAELGPPRHDCPRICPAGHEILPQSPPSSAPPPPASPALNRHYVRPRRFGWLVRPC
jgi:hypothetical protein